LRHQDAGSRYRRVGLTIDDMARNDFVTPRNKKANCDDRPQSDKDNKPSQLSGVSQVDDHVSSLPLPKRVAS
jgi:hypothetical protein